MFGLLVKMAAFGLVTIMSAAVVGVTMQGGISTPKTPPATLGTNTNPIVSCGPGINSKQYVNVVRRSECENYTDCQLKDGSWEFIRKTECDSIQRGVDSNPVVSNPKVDCTGPDGKHLQITQQECDNFNNAWANHKPGQENSGVSCQIVPGQSIQTRDQAECDSARASFPGYTVKYTSPSFQNTYTPPAPSINWNPPSFSAPDFGPVPTFQLSPEVLHVGEAQTNQSNAWVQDMTNKYGGNSGKAYSSQGVPLWPGGAYSSQGVPIYTNK